MKLITKKKAIYGFVVLLALVLAFSLFSMSSTNDKFNFCVFGSNGNPLCVKSASSGLTAAISASGQGVNGQGTTFYPGTSVDIYAEVDYNRDFVPPLYLAQMSIKNTDSGQTVEVWDISEAIKKQPKIAQCTVAAACIPYLQSAYTPCPSKDICTTLKTVFGTPYVKTISAPDVPGNYQISYFIRDSQSGDNLFERSDTSIKVIAKPLACTVGARTCTSWVNDDSQSDSVATIQTRICSTYDDKCAKIDKPEFRTNCASGYLITGQSGTSSTGVKTCNEIKKEPVYTKQPDTTTNTQPPAVSPPPAATNQGAQTNQTPPVVSCTVTNTCKVEKTNTFTQFFADFWTTIKDWFYNTFG